VIAEAATGKEAIEQCRRLRPNLVLMDIRMPMDGLEATRAIKQEFPRINVIIVTMHENPDYLFEALKAGSAGYVLKDATQREVVTAVRQVLRGSVPGPGPDRHLGPEIDAAVEVVASGRALAAAESVIGPLS